MKISKSLTAIVVVWMLAAMATCAMAASISYTTSTPVPYSTTDWTSNLLFQKFNPSIGALYQVDITINAAIKTTLTITNDAASSSTGYAKTEMVVTVTDPLALVSIAPDLLSPAFNYNLAPGQQVVSGLLTKSGSDMGSWTDAAVLAEFTGAGDISMLAGTYTQTLLANTGGNTAASQVTQAMATGTVTYYYNEIVPEPTSLSILGSALLGTLAFARRRRS